MGGGGGGGGGGKTPNVPTQKKVYICNLYARASASETRIHLHTQSMQWYGTINDSMTDETLTLRIIYEHASEF